MRPSGAEISRPEPVAPARVLRRRLVAISASVLIGALLMALKFYAFHLTRSAAILSDALESIINVVAGLFAMGSILLAAKPPDVSHPYGHGKIEFFSAGFEGALIVLAALGIFKTAWTNLSQSRGLPHLDLGVFLLAATAVVNLALGLMLVRTGKKNHSLTLVADGRHVLTDVLTSTGVVAGLILIRLTGWMWIDSGIAFVVGLYIMTTGICLVKRSFLGLMDTSDPELLSEVTSLLKRHRRPLWIDIHQLRAFRTGDRIHIDFHLVLPRDLSLETAHRQARIIETVIARHYGGRASVLIHMDPCIDPACPTCARSACELRDNAFESQNVWSLDELVQPQTTRKKRRDDA